jgi:C1A family cysteine protease
MSELTTRKLNWKREPVDSRDLKSVRHLSAPIVLPSSFELDKKIPIYDQGNIGSCTANSACACFRFETAQIQGDFNFEPSRLFQYYNSRLLQGWQNEDSGAYIRDAFKAMNKFGLALEKTWPYRTSDFAVRPSDASYKEALGNVAVKYAAVGQSETEIKQTLLSGAAISFGFNVYSSFFGSWDRTTGIMPIPKKTESLQGGHAVTIVGYDDSKKCFLIQNSWGTDWGIKGMFWMPYSFLLNAKECDDFWCIQEVKVNGGTTPVPPTPSTVDWITAAKVLFKTASELYAVKKPTIIRLGQALNLPVDASKNFTYNYNIVKTKLGL